MIALNELIQNKELFEHRYKLKGQKPRLEKIFNLEAKRKELQLNTEAMRAKCNKLCGSVATLKNNGEDTSVIIREILKLDRQISKNNIMLNHQTKQINKLLSKLHNLPDDENLSNLQLNINPNSSTLEELESFLSSISNIKLSSEPASNYLKQMQNMIADDLPQIIKCKDEYLILTTQAKFEETKNKILDYFKSHAEHIIKVSIKKIPKECAASYLVHLNKHTSLYANIIREFYTRQHKIKYHDKACDMTKFVNQISIKIRWELVHLKSDNFKSYDRHRFRVVKANYRAQT